MTEGRHLPGGRSGVIREFFRWGLMFSISGFILLAAEETFTYFKLKYLFRGLTKIAVREGAGPLSPLVKSDPQSNFKTLRFFLNIWKSSFSHLLGLSLRCHFESSSKSSSSRSTESVTSDEYSPMVSAWRSCCIIKLTNWLCLGTLDFKEWYHFLWHFISEAFTGEVMPHP